MNDAEETNQDEMTTSEGHIMITDRSDGTVVRVRSGDWTPVLLRIAGAEGLPRTACPRIMDRLRGGECVATAGFLYAWTAEE